MPSLLIPSMEAPGAKWLAALTAAGYVIAIAYTVVWWISELIALRRTRADRAFSERPEGVVEYPVEIVIAKNGERIGCDRGIVWFEDGLLRFNGTACSFALTAGDFVSKEFRHRLSAAYRLPSRALWLRTETSSASVRFLPLGTWQRYRFDLALGRFFGRRATSAEPRQWPPLIGYGEAPALATPRCDDPAEVGVAAARTGFARGVLRR